MKTVFLAAFSIFAMAGCSSETAEERAARACADPIGAWVASQRYLKSHLKSPSSAEFPSSAVAAEHVSGCKHVVVSDFEAQNAFGVMMKQRYSATMTYDKSSRSWIGSELNIQ